MTLPPSVQAACSAPAPVQPDHDLSKFDCGKVPLNDWLRNHALKNEGRASRTFVTCSGTEVVGYYTLATGSVSHQGAPRTLRHRMPDPVPVLVLGRMAVDQRLQGKGIGPGLLKDALQRALTVSGSVGARAVLVHAIDKEVVSFYTRYGFKIFGNDDLTLYLPMESISAALGA